MFSTPRMPPTANRCCPAPWPGAWRWRPGRRLAGGITWVAPAACSASISSVPPARRRIYFHTLASQPIMSQNKSKNCSRAEENMPIKVGINGYGRIGRNILRALYESKRTHEIQIVAINDLGDAQTNAHLTRYDSAHGKFPGEVRVDGDAMVVNGDRIRVLAQRDPAKLPWGEVGAGYILECTGLFSTRAKARGHLTGVVEKGGT